MGSRYQPQTALFGPKTLINYVTASSPLSLRPKSAQKGLEKQGRLRGFGLRAELFSTDPTAPHRSRIGAWCGLVRVGLVRALSLKREPLYRER